MSLLVAKDIHKTYSTGAKDLEVLKGVGLGIEPGSAMAILGASGAGKSTLLHCLGGLDAPNQGEVLYQGKSLYQFPEAKLASFRNRAVGFIFQFHHLLPMLTAQENTALPLRIGGESKEQAAKKASALLSNVGLGERLHHRPDELSGGEQQRVAIARALVAEPEVVLADEPTGNLDSRRSQEIMDLLLKLRQERGCSLVVVTHNDGVAGRLDQKVTLKDGKII